MESIDSYSHDHKSSLRYWELKRKAQRLHENVFAEGENNSGELINPSGEDVDPVAVLAQIRWMVEVVR